MSEQPGLCVAAVDSALAREVASKNPTGGAAGLESDADGRRPLPVRRVLFQCGTLCVAVGGGDVRSLPPITSGRGDLEGVARQTATRNLARGVLSQQHSL